MTNFRRKSRSRNTRGIFKTKASICLICQGYLIRFIDWASPAGGTTSLRLLFSLFRHLGHDRGQVHLAEVPDFFGVFRLVIEDDLLQHRLLHRFPVSRQKTEHPRPAREPLRHPCAARDGKGAGERGRRTNASWGWCTGTTQRDGMGREEGSGWGTHVYLWRIHFDIWQN